MKRIPVGELNGRMVTKCPFHKEKTGSMLANFDNGTYHCFGCGKDGHLGGTLLFRETTDQYYDWIMKMEKEKHPPKAETEKRIDLASVAEAIAHLDECRSVLEEIYGQVGRLEPDGVDPYLWTRAGLLVGEGSFPPTTNTSVVVDQKSIRFRGLLHNLRNPYGKSEEEMRDTRLAAADVIEWLCKGTPEGAA